MTPTSAPEPVLAGSGADRAAAAPSPQWPDPFGTPPLWSAPPPDVGDAGNGHVGDDPATDRGVPGRAGGAPTSLTARMSVLDEIVKAYDVRGTVPDQLNADVARALGVAFARYAAAGEIVVGRDMRPTGPALVAAFTDGVLSQGVDVIDIGLASSDTVYFAAGHLDRPGVVFTASHNPAEYNGAKFCLEGARPVAVGRARRDQGRRQHGARRPRPRRCAACRDAVRARPAAGVRRARPVVRRRRRDPAAAGRRRHRQRHGRPRRPGGLRAHPAVELEVMYGELDGTFPNHPADPLQPANQRDLRHA